MIRLFDDYPPELSPGYHAIQALAQKHEQRVRIERHERRAQSSAPAAPGAVGGPPRRAWIIDRDGARWGEVA